VAAAGGPNRTVQSSTAYSGGCDAESRGATYRPIWELEYGADIAAQGPCAGPGAPAGPALAGSGQFLIPPEAAGSYAEARLHVGEDTPF
jgi:hypothetical protein